MPQPTETTIKWDMEEGNKSASRKIWFDQLFKTPEGTTFESIELDRAIALHRQRRHVKRSPFEEIADGKIIGEWSEIGSDNQAGSVVATSYIPETKTIYTIGAGGSLFKGNIDGKSWEVINQDFRFRNHMLEAILDSTGQIHLIAFSDGKALYSTDEGKTWEVSSGFNGETTAQFKQIFTIKSDSTRTYFIGKPKTGTNTNICVYQSVDYGKNWSILKEFNTPLLDLIAHTKIKNSDTYVLIEQTSSFFSNILYLNEDKTKLITKHSSSNFSFKNARSKVVGTTFQDTTYLYAYDSDNNLHQSKNGGQSWSIQGKLPTNPWTVGIDVAANNPNFLMVGAVECFRTFNGGKNWSVINYWYDYYANVKHKIHADMMYFLEIPSDSPEKNWFLIGNHGGMSVLKEYANDTENISLKGLNVSQYYDVTTHPEDEDFIYAGSQDQGFQRGMIDDEKPYDFDQVISGDYGHNTFSNSNKSLWSVYPFGFVIYFKDAKYGGVSASVTINTGSQSVWIPPLASSYDENAKYVFMGGRSASSADDGSYILQLTPSSNAIQVSQLGPDFKALSGGTISSLVNTGEDGEKFYVGTTNGQFYYSDDYGDTFEKSKTPIISGHYLYGSKILVSKENANTIYVGGNGYNSGFSVLRSTDGGINYEPFSDDLPPTTVLDLAYNPDESLLFAATSSGPYVCIMSESKWYPMFGTAAPNVVYWSVECINDGNKVRFGTYARGIWDFDIQKFVANKNIKQNASPTIKAYPNPTSDIIQVEWNDIQPSNVQLMHSSGTVLQQWPSINNTIQSIDLSDKKSGVYFLNYTVNNESFTLTLNKQ